MARNRAASELLWEFQGEETLEFHYLCGLKAFGAFGDRELNSVSFIERFET
jgi:hypothetical protein